LEHQALTGLTAGQLGTLILLVRQETGDVVRPGGRPAAIGLGDSVKMVVALMRRNLVQEIAGEIFGCSQPTVSRRWDLLRPVIGKVLAGYVPDPVQVLGREGTVLVDGTICPVWDWAAIPDLYSGKAGYRGMNVQVAANLSGDVVAIGPHALHGARNDAVAFEMPGLKDLLENRAARETAAATSATQASTASPSCRSASPAAKTSWTGRSTSTPSSAKSAPPSSTPTPPSSAGACSAKKEAATAARSASTTPCSRPSPDCSSSANTTKRY
jgi:hypothetical protein